MSRKQFSRRIHYCIGRTMSNTNVVLPGRKISEVFGAGGRTRSPYTFCGTGKGKKGGGGRHMGERGTLKSVYSHENECNDAMMTTSG